MADFELRPEVFVWNESGKSVLIEATGSALPARLRDDLSAKKDGPISKGGYNYWVATSEPDEGGNLLHGAIRIEERSLDYLALERYGAFFGLSVLSIVALIGYVFHIQRRILFRPLSHLFERIAEEIEGISGSIQSDNTASDEMVGLNTRYDELIEVARRQRNELKVRSEELRHLLDALPAYVWYKDDKNNIVRVNRSAAESVGYSIEALEGKSIEEIFPEEASAYYKDDKEVIESGVPKLGYTESYSPVSGKARTIRTDKIPYVDSDGNVTGVVALVTDISELVELQKEREASDRLIRRLVEIGSWESEGVDERIAAALKDTCEALGMKTGILSEISDGRYTVRQVYDERGLISPGFTCTLDDVYCNFVLMTGCGIASNHIAESTWGEMDCYKRLRLESYVASPVRRGGKITGTINFSSPEIRSKPFAQFEIDAVQLLSNWIEGLIRQEEIVEQLNRQKVELRLILDTTPSQIWFRDEENRILRANQAAAASLGLSVEEVEGKLASELFSDGYDRIIDEDSRILETGEPFLGGIRSCITNSGGTVWFRYDKLPFDLGEGRRGIVSVVSEITEIVESQNAVKEADERFRVAVEESPVGMLIVDSALRVVLVNYEVERIFGYERDALLWRSVDHVLGSRVLTALDCLFDAEERIEEKVRLGSEGDLFAKRKDDLEIPVEVIVSPYSLLGNNFALVSVFDISERIESQRAMLDSEERFQLAAEGASVGIWDWLDTASKQEWWSPKFYELLGYDRDDLESSLETFRSLLHPDDLESTFASVQKCFEERLPFAADYRLLCKNGEYNWFLGSGMVSFDESGKPRRMTGTIQDINDRKVAEEKLSSVVTDLQRANEELSNFAFLSSHDLQEPLRTISSFLNLLKDDYGSQLDESANEYMDFTLVAVSRLQNMIRSLLLYCRLDSRERAESLISLKEPLEMGLRDLATRIEESGTEVEVVGPLTEVYGDINQISLVFQNLIANAIKFNRSSKPKVKVSCRVVSSAEIAKEGFKAEAYTVVSVADNGIGIRQKYQQRIFSIFQKLHPSGEYEGSGVGLSMVRKILEQHRGFVWLESEEGRGSCFYLAFPNRLQS
ncbi:PAS domain S-box protein [Pelagicoccus sp. SDUM812002]|nr:PAS domain S-box protein [Pelagicoccus sp. SDUM812002]